MKVQFQSNFIGKEKDLKKINTVELCLKKKKNSLEKALMEKK